MRLLVLAEALPMSDRASGDLRFLTLLGLLAKRHSVTLCGLNASGQRKRLGPEAFETYADTLVAHGVTLVEDGLLPLLKNQVWDGVLFEFYQPARQWLDEVRFRQPGARIVIDSVDVHFRRFAAKAELTGNEDDRVTAARVRRDELDIYRRADAVIVVTEDDRRTLQTVLPGLPLLVLPNVHAIFPPIQPASSVPDSLIFIGGFQHEPNTDAMLYFCGEVMPLIRRAIPGVRLCIVGSNPPETIRSLVADSIEVTGYVPDTAPYLAAARISIAPLRYGAGMKGKIGEAMSHGLPVVTTSVGAEGFGLTSGEHILLGDSAADFAEHVIHLLQDQSLYERIRLAGWEFIRSRYSLEAVEKLTRTVMAEMATLDVATLPRLKRWRLAARDAYENNVGWRFH
ncbi:MAG: glycosyltransferase [Sulfuricellaceae bacterium]|nr:glycosyltransferase [Sulfuricellaceae bacterium]